MEHFNQSPCYLKDAYEAALQDALFIIDHLSGIANPQQVSKYLRQEDADEFYMRKARFLMAVDYLKENGVQFGRWVRIPNWNSQEVANKNWYNATKKWEV